MVVVVVVEDTVRAPPMDPLRTSSTRTGNLANRATTFKRALAKRACSLHPSLELIRMPAIIRTQIATHIRFDFMACAACVSLNDGLRF